MPPLLASRHSFSVLSAQELERRASLDASSCATTPTDTAFAVSSRSSLALSVGDASCGVAGLTTRLENCGFNSSASPPLPSPLRTSASISSFASSSSSRRSHHYSMDTMLSQPHPYAHPHTSYPSHAVHKTRPRRVSTSRRSGTISAGVGRRYDALETIVDRMIKHGHTRTVSDTGTTTSHSSHGSQDASWQRAAVLDAVDDVHDPTGYSIRRWMSSVDPAPADTAAPESVLMALRIGSTPGSRLSIVERPIRQRRRPYYRRSLT